MKVVAFVTLTIAASQAFSVKEASGYHAKVGIPLARQLELAEERGASQAFSVKEGSGYHAKVGIPLARQLKLAEERGENTLSQRISGGHVVDISQVPYHVAVLAKVFFIYWSYCGGSLISPTRVLTAAHCYDEETYPHIDFIQTVHGTNMIYTGGERRFTTDIVIHPMSNNWYESHNIAVIRIDAVTLSNVIQPIALPSAEDTNDYVGQFGLVTGYGLPYEEAELSFTQHLSAVAIPIVDIAQCFRYFGSNTPVNQICASGEGGRGICIGDDGGPLIITIRGIPTLIGVGSRFPFYCGDEEPTLFTKVSYYVPWINSIL